MQTYKSDSQVDPSIMPCHLRLREEALPIQIPSAKHQPANRVTNPQQPHVYLILRAPRLGQVKTRLAKTIGDKNALAAYKRLVERQVNAIPETWNLELHYTPHDAEEEMISWLGDTHTLSTQTEGDLGDRLTAAAQRHFKNTPAPLFFIGADCPGIDAALLEQAASQLGHSDLTIGPASDGGYYLIGMRSFYAGLFEQIEWGTGNVFEQTMTQARKLALKTTELPEKFDVDTEEDWKRTLKLYPELSASERAHKTLRSRT